MFIYFILHGPVRYNHSQSSLVPLFSFIFFNFFFFLLQFAKTCVLNVGWIVYMAVYYASSSPSLTILLFYFVVVIAVVVGGVHLICRTEDWKQLICSKWWWFTILQLLQPWCMNMNMSMCMCFYSFSRTLSPTLPVCKALHKYICTACWLGCMVSSKVTA